MRVQLGSAASQSRWLGWLWIGCALATLAASQQSFYTHGRYGKRQGPQQASLFWSGSRYGRGGPSSSSTSSDGNAIDTKQLAVAPRTDRFFLGSRYGKRTSQPPKSNSLRRFDAPFDYLDHLDSDAKQVKTLPLGLIKDMGNEVTESIGGDNGSVQTGSVTTEDGLTCLYTGVTNLYRCFQRLDNGSQESSN